MLSHYALMKYKIAIYQSMKQMIQKKKRKTRKKTECMTIESKLRRTALFQRQEQQEK